MPKCAACGRWADDAAAPCPHCGVTPPSDVSLPESSLPPRSDTLAFMDEILAELPPESGEVALGDPASHAAPSAPARAAPRPAAPAAPHVAPHAEPPAAARSASPAPAADPHRVRPKAHEFERWYSALDESPVFAADDASKPPAPAPHPKPEAAKPLPPAVQPLADLQAEFIEEEDTGAFAEPVVPAPSAGREAPADAAAARPNVAALLAAEEVRAGGDARRIDIGCAFEMPSFACADEPLVNLLVTLTAEGPPLLDRSEGPIAHVILALDLSASMNQTDKYPLLTEALAGMLYDLKRPGMPDVLLSIVVFAYGTETVFRDQVASKLEPRDVLRQIDRSKLRFGRYTDFVGALKRSGKIAYDQVRRNKAMPVRICVLTDGRPQDMPGAQRAIGLIRRLPVDVEALAFGKDADVAVLQELCNGGRGGTVKQVRADTISDAFGHIAEAASQVISNRALFEMELRPGVAGGKAYRYRPARHRFPDPAFGDDRVFKTDLGTLEAGRRYSLFFQVRLPETEALETEVGRVTVRLPGRGGPLVFESILSVPRHRGEATFQGDREVEVASEVLGALGAANPEEQLRALRARRKLYVAERRDPRLLQAIDNAIRELESHGNLAGLSAAEQSAILSHTATVGRIR